MGCLPGLSGSGFRAVSLALSSYNTSNFLNSSIHVKRIFYMGISFLSILISGPASGLGLRELRI